MTDEAYNSAKDFIYKIGGHEMSTDSTIVADVYCAIRRIMEEPDSELNDWVFLLNNAERQLRHYASECGVANDDAVFGKLTAGLTNIRELYADRIADAADVHEMLEELAGHIADYCRWLEESQPRPKLVIDYIPAYDPCELMITAAHTTRDMSVGGYYENNLFVPYSRLYEQKAVDGADESCGKVRIVSCSPQQIVLSWAGNEYTLKLGESVTTEPEMCNNPMLSVDKLAMTFEYRPLTSYRRATDIVLKVCDAHRLNGGWRKLDCTEAEQAALDLVNHMISNEGDVEMYPMKALLDASNDWSTFVITRMSHFKAILLEGIEKGCLAPQCDLAWQWLEMAATNNEPTLFVDDMDLYYDLLATAAEEGNSIALDIMNTIWEPEQIIEED
ncbi:MAG: hypothetical protein ACI4A8_07970 [Muribaculaceae bacterium]